MAVHKGEKYPPDVKIITLDGTLPAHRGILCQNKSIDAKFYPTDGNPSENGKQPPCSGMPSMASTLGKRYSECHILSWNTTLWNGFEIPLPLYRNPNNPCYSQPYSLQLEQTTSHTTLHYIEKLALEYKVYHNRVQGV